MGQVVMVHEDGIDVLDPPTKTVRYFDSNSGLSNFSPSLNSISKCDQEPFGSEDKIKLSDIEWMKELVNNIPSSFLTKSECMMKILIFEKIMYSSTGIILLNSILSLCGLLIPQT